MGVFPGSSMVEQEAVNFEVAGSSPVPGAIKSPSGFFRAKKMGSDLAMRAQSREPTLIIMIFDILQFKAVCLGDIGVFLVVDLTHK